MAKQLLKKKLVPAEKPANLKDLKKIEYSRKPKTKTNAKEMPAAQAFAPRPRMPKQHQHVEFKEAKSQDMTSRHFVRVPVDPTQIRGKFENRIKRLTKTKKAA